MAWTLRSTEFPAYITALGILFAPPTRQEPLLTYVFLRLNFDCTSGDSLIKLYAGHDLGLSFVHKQSGYSDIFIEDMQGRKYLVTLLGSCWLAAPMPRSVLREGFYELQMKNLPPFRFQIQPESPNLDNPIAFVSDRDGTKEVFIADSNGANPRRITTDFSSVRDPAWSPDRTKIAYVSHRRGNPDILVAALAGGSPEYVAASPHDEGGPAWSPDGVTLAYHTNQNGNWDIFLQDLESQATKKLTPSLTDEMFPSWSPDGKLLSYQYNPNGNWDIAILDVEDKTIRPLIQHPGDDILPIWSPDGKSIIYWSNRSGRWQLYLIELIEGLPKALTGYENPGPIPSRAAWSPDGNRIIISLLRGNLAQLFSLTLDGSPIQRLMNSGANDIMPAW